MAYQLQKAYIEFQRKYYELCLKAALQINI